LAICVRSSEVVSTDIDDEVVMMRIEQGTYSGVAAIGSERGDHVPDLDPNYLLDPPTTFSWSNTWSPLKNWNGS